MDENLVVLEQIKDKLEKYELIDSNNKQIKSKLVEEIKAKVESLKIYTPSKQDTKNKDIYESVKELIEKVKKMYEKADDISNYLEERMLEIRNLKSYKKEIKRMEAIIKE